MKLYKFYLPLLSIAAIATGCSEDENFDLGGENSVGNNYLAVKIDDSSSLSRDAVFENGTGEESKIEKIRFYFFDANGMAASVRHTPNGYVNHLDWENPAMSLYPNENPYEQTSIEAVLLVQTPEGDRLPAQVVAIANPFEATPRVNVSITEMWQDIRDHSTQSGAFFMINSTYYSNNKVNFAVDVTAHFESTSEAAKSKPVIITLERVLAKARVRNQIATPVSGQSIHATSETIDKTEEGMPIYVKFLGWGLTTTTDKSYMVKHIANWNDDLFAVDNSEPWNDVSNKRSYWAYNPNDVGYRFISYNECVNSSTDFTGGSGLYCQENAAPTSAGGNPVLGSRTQLIVAAQLTDEAGNPLNVVECRGMRMHADRVVDGQVSADERGKGNGFLDYIMYTSFIHEITINGAAVTRDDIEFVTEHALNNHGQWGYNPEVDHYAVYLQLKAGLANVVHTNEYGDATVGLDAVNAMLVNEYGKIKYWNNGQTYYYTDIKHLGRTGRAGEYGVVRNHIYSMQLDRLSGLGTPVYDPIEPIVPEKPESDETYLAARVDVLAWRVVVNYVTFE